MSGRPFGAALVGRSFVHPVFDYLLVGGGLSLIVTALVLLNPAGRDLVDRPVLPYFMLFSNSAHFASSTIRLYTKPGTYVALPFLTTTFPLVVLAVLLGCLWLASEVGPHLQAVYLTWSPYHYAAQAYGLAVVYSYRSGCQLTAQDKSLLWWSSLLPFFYATIGDLSGGLHWILPSTVFANPTVHSVIQFLLGMLLLLSFASAVLIFLKVFFSASGPMPVISMLILVANTAWWCLLPNFAFVWATIFHGLQYLVVVGIFHVNDQMAKSDNRYGWLQHAAGFYFSSLLLGYALFSCLPWGFVAVGFGMVESIALSVAAINIHHFVVDAYIWRLKKGDANRKNIEGPAMAVAA